MKTRKDSKKMIRLLESQTSKTKPAHTPTPWTFDGRYLLSANKTPVYSTFRLPSKEDGVFIVRAVNAHEELVEVLRDYIADLECANGQWTLARLKELLAKAEGKE